MINFKSFLTESRHAPLYHGTDIQTLLSLIETDTLKAYDGDEGMTTRGKAISFTRIRKYAANWAYFKAGMYNQCVVLEIDKDKLIQRYSVKPYNFNYQASDTKVARIKDRHHHVEYGNNEYEEYVGKDITNISRYITKIYVSIEFYNKNQSTVDHIRSKFPNAPVVKLQ